MKKPCIYTLVAVILVAIIVLCYINENVGQQNCISSISDEAVKAEDLIVVIDPGHGGYDPGKVSEQGNQEKNINLDISMILKKKIESLGMTVVMTRTEDVDLSNETGEHITKSKKTKDLNERIHIINDSEAVLALSIHQNSFVNESAKGAQAFYYEGSTEGKKIAGYIHDCLVELNNDNDRNIKGNKDYYLLKHSSIPTVIVECGFLSNSDDLRKLQSKDYQDMLAEKICKGIVNYLNEEVL